MRARAHTSAERKQAKAIVDVVIEHFEELVRAIIDDAQPRGAIEDAIRLRALKESFFDDVEADLVKQGIIEEAPSDEDN